MLWFWGFVTLFVVSLLIFGFIMDRKTDRYRLMDDQKTKEGIEAIKDEAQNHTPPGINHKNHWF